MVELSGFSSVFEITFALNALFFFFEFVPEFDRRFTRLGRKWFAIIKRRSDRVNMGNEQGIATGIPLLYSDARFITLLISLINSVISLCLLILVGFFPDLAIGWGWIVLVLALLIGGPVWRMQIHSKLFKIVEDSIEKHQQLYYEGQRRDEATEPDRQPPAPSVDQSPGADPLLHSPQSPENTKS